MSARLRPSWRSTLSVFLAESTVALTLFQLLSTGRTALDPLTWLAAWAAAGAASFLGASAVWLVIRLHAGRADLPRLLAAATVTTTCNVSLAIIGVILLVRDRVGLVPLVLIVGVSWPPTEGSTG